MPPGPGGETDSEVSVWVRVAEKGTFFSGLQPLSASFSPGQRVLSVLGPGGRRGGAKRSGAAGALAA